jgi:acyl-coenzyme A synthetase/AMP-(fatty) acid ligase
MVIVYILHISGTSGHRASTRFLNSGPRVIITEDAGFERMATADKPRPVHLRTPMRTTAVELLEPVTSRKLVSIALTTFRRRVTAPNRTDGLGTVRRIELGR